MMLRLHITVSGKVQGVGFRYHAQRKAQEMGITGWAQNLPTREVEIVAEGTEEKLTLFADWCKSGSPYGNVDTIVTKKEKYRGEFTRFEVRYF